jgi:hypothetical protein
MAAATGCQISSFYFLDLQLGAVSICLVPKNVDTSYLANISVVLSNAL